MLHIDIDAKGSKNLIRECIKKKEHFIVYVRGHKAKVMSKILPAGGVILVTPEIIMTILKVLSLAIIVGLILYGISKGYKIKGKRTTLTEEIEFEFSPS